MGPILTAIFVYLTFSRKSQTEISWSIVLWYISGTLVYYLVAALRNAIWPRSSN